MTEKKPTLEYETPPPSEPGPFNPAELVNLVWAALFLAGVFLLLGLFLWTFTRH